MLERTPNEPCELDATIDELTVGLRAFAREQACELFVELDAEGTSFFLEDRAAVLEEGVEGVMDSHGRLAVAIDEGEIAGRPHSVATDVRPRFNHHYIRAGTRCGGCGSHACGAGSNDEHIGLLGDRV